MSKYTETFDVCEQYTVTVEVEGAETEAQAQELADLYRGDEGYYRHSPGNVLISIERVLDDSNTDSNEDGEWEPDDDEEEDDGGY